MAKQAARPGCWLEWSTSPVRPTCCPPPVLQGRVRTALAKKDEAIAALREQLEQITQQLAEAGLE